MTINDCGLLLLAHFPFEERTIPDDAAYPGRNAAVVAAMYAALEECYSRESPWIREDDVGDILRPAASVTISVTENSRSAEITTGWAAWMAGCTIVIAGHDIDNQIRSDAAECTLKFPYGGTSGSVSATVYQDCLTLDAGVLLPVPPIRVDGRPIPSLMSGSAISNPLHAQDFGMHQQIEAYDNIDPRRASDLVGFVRGCSVESYASAGTMVPANRLRLHGTVSATSTISFKAKLKPPVITDLASTDIPPIPHEFVASIFLPIARQKLVASPFFRDQAGKEEIASAYKEARTTLASINTNLPSRFRFQP